MGQTPKRKLSGTNTQPTQLELGILDQLPVLRTYTQTLFCFPLPSTATKSTIITHLEKATNKLIENVPYLGGQISIYDEVSESKETTTSRTTVIPDAKSKHHPLHINNLESTHTPYPSLDSSQFPASVLSSTSLAPMKGLPYIYSANETPSPVLAIQANFIPGGLLLCFSASHNITDATGLAQAIRLFARALRDEPFHPDDIKAANMSRFTTASSKTTDDKAHSTNHDYLLWNPTNLSTDLSASSDKSTTDAGDPQWSYFRLSGARLALLKTRLTTMLPSDIPFISSNDIITALIWRAITRSRLYRHGTNDTSSSTLMRAVDGRGRLSPPLPKAYLGSMMLTAFTQQEISALSSLPADNDAGSGAWGALAATVFALRRSLYTMDNTYYRSVATYLHHLSSSDRARFVFGMSDLARNVYVTSWASMPVGEDFGELLGRPDAVRRPTFQATEGSVYLMPRDREGDWDLLLGSREGDLERIRGDGEWAGVARWIG